MWASKTKDEIQETLVEAFFSIKFNVFPSIKAALSKSEAKDTYQKLTLPRSNQLM